MIGGPIDKAPISMKPKITGDARDFISREISRQRKEGKPVRQSIAIAFSKARKQFPKQRKKLQVKLTTGNPNGISDKKLQNLLVTLFGVAIALQILRQVRTS